MEMDTAYLQCADTIIFHDLQRELHQFVYWHVTESVRDGYQLDVDQREVASRLRDVEVEWKDVQEAAERAKVRFARQFVVTRPFAASAGANNSSQRQHAVVDSPFRVDVATRRMVDSLLDHALPHNALFDTLRFPSAASGLGRGRQPGLRARARAPRQLALHARQECDADRKGVSS